MNTVRIGDVFEDKSYYLIEKAIKNGELGISESSAKVYKKKSYYSQKREKDIIFDLSIEIWPKNAKRYTLLFLIECKSSKSKKVPVDDIEEFYTKINQVAGVNVKGIMISDNSFQSGSITFAKNTGMMLIEVDNNDNHSIILHRTDKNTFNNRQKNTDEIMFSFIKKVLGLKKVEGLKILSSEQIENFAGKILTKYSKPNYPIDIDGFIGFLENEYHLKFDLNSQLEAINGKMIEGYFDVKNKKILIDKSVLLKEKYPFLLGHELGHFFLHSKLKINQEVYNDFKDSEYNIFTDRHALKNDKNWIEWQANKFAIALFLPKKLFLTHFLNYRKKILGKSRAVHIYLDNQTVNKQDYYKTVDYLSDYFGISKTAVKYRIEDFGLITYAYGKDEFQTIGSILKNGLK